MRRATAVARRYAKALQTLAAEARLLEPVAQELATFERLLSSEPALRDVLLRPWVPAATKHRVVTTIAQHLGLAPLTRNFLGLLARRRRLEILDQILAAYRTLVDEAAGRVRARVRSATPLADTERAAIRERLGRRVGKTVLIDTEVDAALLGGFVAEVGSRVLDASLAGQLRALREEIVKGSGGSP